MANVKRSILNRIFFSFTCVVVFAFLVLYYIFNIQIAEGTKWRSLSDSLTLKYKVIHAVRGNIYSDDGTLLATSVPRYEIRMDLTVLKEDTFNKYMPILASLYSKKFKDKPSKVYLAEFIKARREKNRYYSIQKKLNFLDIKEIKSWPLYKKGRYKSGLIVEEDNYRVMPFINLLARTIGYSSNIAGKQPVGIEGAYNKQLAGVTGRRLVQRIAGGYRPINDHNEVEPVNGKDIYTTIDINLQDIVNQALKNGLMTHKAHHGCAIVMNVKTGEIKAIANLTSNSKGDYVEILNYAINESFEPGSTFKLISVLALLEKNRIKVSDSVLINYGKWKIGNKEMLDAEHSAYKANTFSYAFIQSSNVGISTSMMKGFEGDPKSFTDYIRELKLDQPLDIEIDGEGMPYIKSPGSTSWSKYSLPWMSIGYELKLTPLQILTVYNAVANDGKMMKPYLIKAIGSKGEVEKEYDKQVLLSKIASGENIKIVKQMLEEVVENGTASRIKDCKVKIAGKTGTAQISDGKKYLEGAYYSSFAGYFPAHKPQYSIIVVINRPQEGGYFGGVVAAPVVKEIAEKISGIIPDAESGLADSLNQKTDFPKQFVGKRSETEKFIDKYLNTDYYRSGSKYEWAKARIDSTGDYSIEAIKDLSDLVPDLKGMGLRDAIFFAEGKGLKVIASGMGRVYWQSMAEGSKLIKGKTILVKLKL